MKERLMHQFCYGPRWIVLTALLFALLFRRPVGAEVQRAIVDWRADWSLRELLALGRGLSPYTLGMLSRDRSLDVVAALAAKNFMNLTAEQRREVFSKVNPWSDVSSEGLLWAVRNLEIDRITQFAIAKNTPNALVLDALLESGDPQLCEVVIERAGDPRNFYALTPTVPVSALRGNKRGRDYLDAMAPADRTTWDVLVSEWDGDLVSLRAASTSLAA